jgi:hypothetical protein
MKFPLHSPQQLVLVVQLTPFHQMAAASGISIPVENYFRGVKDYAWLLIGEIAVTIGLNVGMQKLN